MKHYNLLTYIYSLHRNQPTHYRSTNGSNLGFLSPTTESQTDLKKLRENMRHKQRRNFNRKSCEMRKSVERVSTNDVAASIMKLTHNSSQQDSTNWNNVSMQGKFYE